MRDFECNVLVRGSCIIAPFRPAAPADLRTFCIRITLRKYRRFVMRSLGVDIWSLSSSLAGNPIDHTYLTWHRCFVE